ncbi:potassium/proton antiporter [Microlunatus parietis]|uniref:Cell volume regulation protein A n=1 Tax=Microlunatus parietis TaxID=682979 RepID=A0A7Y9I852_9ACTN|nr:potassium/proton antiporter [Microlunatus parietis]NYE71736.1 cell volume regulation protein A [Microlunatus parietis]
MEINLDGILLVSAVVLIAAIIAARLGARIGLPSLLLFLGLGMLMGDSGLGLQFSDPDLARALGFGALVLILAEGGLTTRWHDIRSSVGVAGVLATGGIFVSVALMTLFGHFVLGLDLWIAVLLGAVTSPTDAAAVFSVLRRVPIPHRLRGALEAESGLNDAPTVLLVVLASAAATGDQPQGAGGFAGVAVMITFQLVAGGVIGIALGWVGVQILRRVALPSSGLYPLAALVWTVFAYSVGATLNTSGFAAVYICALLLGNAQLPHRGATRSFVEGIGWIAQIGLFIMLGLLASPNRVTLQAVLIALAAGAVLTFVARPVSILVVAPWFRIPLRQQAFLSWAGLRGAIPIVLATIPLSEDVAGGAFLFDVVLVFVIVSTLLQAPTLPLVARLLRLIDEESARDVEVEAAPLDRISADLLQVRIPKGSRLIGVEIGELRLGTQTVVSLVIRDDTPFPPTEQTRIREGDELLIVTPTTLRQHTEDRLRSLGRSGRLARWRERLEDTEN